MPVIRTGGLSRCEPHDETPCTRAVGAGRGTAALREQGSCPGPVRSGGPRPPRAEPGAADPLAGRAGAAVRPSAGPDGGVAHSFYKPRSVNGGTTRTRLSARAPGGRMNVQRRPRCTFILFPDVPEGGKPLELRHHPCQHPRMNVQRRPSPDEAHHQQASLWPATVALGRTPPLRTTSRRPAHRNQAPPCPRCTAHSGTFCAEGNRLRTK